jgi:GNAT superfamily N-acetyltransferase
VQTEIELPGGKRLVVRPLSLDDVSGITRLYAALSSEDRYRRFFSAFHATDRAVLGWVKDAVNRGFGLIALADDGEGEHVVGEAFYVVLANGDGEFALTVHPQWRGWLGPYLLDALVQAAHERGVPNLEADILCDNRLMLSIVRHRGHVLLPASDYQIVRVAVGTGTDGPAWPVHGARPRVLVEGAGVRWHGVDELSRSGFDVYTCPGPGPAGRRRCPAMDGEPCPLAAGADAIVVAYPPGSERGGRLLEAHGILHPDVGVLVEIPKSAGGTLPPGLCRATPEGIAVRVLAALPALAAVRAAETVEEPAGG